jgi:hypothetical protein
MGFEVPSPLNLEVTVFWDMILCGLIGRYQHFRGTCNHYRQDRSMSCGKMEIEEKEMRISPFTTTVTVLH